MKPIIKKVAGNGQISLPKSYRGKHVILKESDSGVIIRLLQWDEKLDTFLAPIKTTTQKEDSFSLKTSKNKPDKRGEFAVRKVGRRIENEE